jgi:O-antigen/teichoic acid export membrane protein
MADARDLLSTGFWFLLAGIIGPLLTYFDRFLIGSVVGVGKLPYYSVPQTILQQSSHIPRALGSVLFPRFSAIKDDSDSARLAVKAMESMAFVVAPICVLLILAMEPILKFWLSGDFAKNSSVVATLLMCSLLPSAMARIVSSQLNGRNRPDLVVKILLLEFIPYAITLYYFAKAFGLLGVAAVWTLRSTADALLLGMAGKVMLPMLKASIFPAALITCSFLVSAAWEMHDPRRWIFSVAICIILGAWAVCFLPPDLVRSVGRVKVLRRAPIGRLYRVGFR